MGKKKVISLIFIDISDSLVTISGPASWAVAKSENFWWATGQSNLVYKSLDAKKVYKVWFSYSHNCTLVSGTGFHSVCQVWLSSGPSGFLSFSCESSGCETSLWSVNNSDGNIFQGKSATFISIVLNLGKMETAVIVWKSELDWSIVQRSGEVYIGFCFHHFVHKLQFWKSKTVSMLATFSQSVHGFISQPSLIDFVVVVSCIIKDKLVCLPLHFGRIHLTCMLY